MSQMNEPCPTCKKPWLSHHSLKEVHPNGKFTVTCHPDPGAPQPDHVLLKILDERADRQRAQADLLEVKKQASLDKQAFETQAKDAYDAMVEAEAAKKAEATRVSLVETHQALVSDLKSQVKESEAIAEQLLTEKRDLAEKSAEEKRILTEKLDEAVRKSIDLQLQVVDLEAKLAVLKSRHQGLKDRSLDIVRTLISMGTRVAVLEQKTGVVPKIDPEMIFKIVTGQEYADEEIPVDRLHNDPTPAPTPAPKAEVATAPPPAPMAVPAPPAAVVVLDDPETESAEPASADDEDEEHDHAVGDDDVAEEQDAESDQDDESEECSMCQKAAKEELSYVKKDGTEGLLVACDPNAHAEEFLNHLKKTAKSAPASAKDVAILFNPIQ